MNCLKKIGFYLVTASILSACQTPTTRAPIEDRNSAASNEAAKYAAQPAAPVKVIDTQTQYVVKKGDTLYRIAQEKGVTYNELVAWNNITNPNDIKVGQVLKIAVDGNAKTNAISMQNGVEVRPLGANSGATSGTSPATSNNKSSPRADKRPYSEANLAEMQKNNGNDIAPATMTPPKAPEQAVAIASEIDWIWPTEGKVINKFDSKTKGIDIAGKMGQPVIAAAAGKVMFVGNNVRGYGSMIIIKHSNNYLTAYANNKTILVTDKQDIKKGQKIAEMGNSDSDTVKLHFEIRQQGTAVDPLKFLPAR